MHPNYYREKNIMTEKNCGRQKMETDKLQEMVHATIFHVKQWRYADISVSKSKLKQSECQTVDSQRDIMT